MLSAPPGAGAQCDSPPRLVPGDVVCDLGEACSVDIDLEIGGLPAASFSAALVTSGTVVCDGTCEVGEAAANGFCTLNRAACRFAIADLLPPLTAFSDGPGVSLSVVCHETGVHTLELAEVSFGTVFGQAFDGCATSSTLRCRGPMGTTTTTVPNHDMCGDPNGDGQVTASDALLTMRAALDLGPCDLAACDVDCTGSNSTSDALMILQFAVGQEIDLDCACAR